MAACGIGIQAMTLVLALAMQCCNEARLSRTKLRPRSRLLTIITTLRQQCRDTWQFLEQAWIAYHRIAQHMSLFFDWHDAERAKVDWCRGVTILAAIL